MKQKISKKPQYTLENDGSFVIENYNFTKPFSSFFPGIAGLYGIPMWVFYINRAQAIASFGVRNKEQSIMEFYPANSSYSLTPNLTFRTFLKVSKGKEIFFYEPFKQSEDKDIIQRMVVRPHELVLEDENKAIGIKTKVTYFTLPNEPLAALVRITEFTNISKEKLNIEFLDGLPKIMPYWVGQWAQKFMSNTAQAWAIVENAAENLRFFRLKVEINDSPEVKELAKGNFYTGCWGSSTKLNKAEVVVDPKIIFGEDYSYAYPFAFFKNKIFKVPEKQLGANKYPCAFSYAGFTLLAGKANSVYSVIGHIDSAGLLREYGKKIAEKDYFEDKRNENKKIVSSLTNDISTKSNVKVFDLYARQTFLDNLLRGGRPIVFSDGNKKTVFYTYSRKHGDLERDYNNFELSPLYYSQGNGSYRDMCQNKRNDIFFNPEAGDVNLKYFYDLIQLDGYNPLQVKGQLYFFDVADENNKKLISGFSGTEPAKLVTFFAKAFEPGELAWFLEKELALARPRVSEFVSRILCSSKGIHEAAHGEGFWTDHWTYCLDLLESYLSVYPEKAREIILDRYDFTFFDSDHIVLPRSKKYVEAQGKVRQFGSVIHEKNKTEAIKGRSLDKNKVRDKNGGIYKTNLFTKMFCLVLNKLATLDASGIGIEMEADKPSWYDALNGLPGVFGSSVPETLELKRNLEFLRDKITSFGLSADHMFRVPVELFDFFKGMDDTLNQMNSISEYTFWDWATSTKEYYRSRIVWGIDGWQKEISVVWFLQFVEKALAKIEKGLAKAVDEKTGLLYTYFSAEAAEYERTGETSSKGLPCVRVKSFKNHALPLFLEAEVHYLKTLKSKKETKEHFELLKKSSLYDKKLNMLKVNASLETEPMDIGRATVFSPGWLENESIWLHMEYKYLLELLKAGLFDDFFEEFEKSGICFQDPEIYGRNILENSSFIASSAFPDKSDWGRGFVARLSGSTAEFIHMWLLMTVGAKPFTIEEKGGLILEFKPAISRKYFTEDGTFEFKFLGKTDIKYHNSKNIDTFSSSFRINKINILWNDGKKESLSGSKLTGPSALRIRNREAKEIEVFF